MTDIKVFENNVFGLLRVINDDKDNPKFIATDVCDALDIANTSSAISTLDSDEKGIEKVDTRGGKQRVLYVTESGLYSLIMRSNKPKAKEFRRWVTGTVLPSIRRSGAYVSSPAVENMLNDPDFAIALFEQLKRERQDRELAEQQRDIAMRIRSIDTDMYEPSIIKRYIHGVVSGQQDNEDEARRDNYYRIGVRQGKTHKDDEDFKRAFCLFWAGYNDYLKSLK